MNGLNEHVDISFLVGATVQEICVCNTALTINFHKTLQIQIFSAFTVSPSEKNPTPLSSYAEDSVVLFPLIGQTILASSATSSGNLKLTFESGIVLEIIDEGDYGSFIIDNDGQTITV